MIRPELVTRFAPWRASAAAATTALAGLWVFMRGGWIYMPLGAGIAMFGIAWLGVELNRKRLGGHADGPGLVEIEEGILRYFAPRVPGGEMALRDLTEIRILCLDGRAYWRLRNIQGEALLVPADATGAGALADGLTALPGADLGRLAGALDRACRDGPAVQTVWVAPAPRHPDAAPSP